MSFAVIGKRYPRVEAKEQVTGRLQFTDDIYIPGMLHIKALFSTEDHARILELDTSEAEKLPGVKGVLTYKDVPYNLTGFILEDQAVLPKDKVVYKGQIVALVAAETEEIASQGVELIKIRYERLPAVFDPRDAMKEDAPIIHEDMQGKTCHGNIALNHGHECLQLIHGNIEEGFAQSDIIIEHSFSTPPQKCAPIEPHRFIAKPDASGKVTVIGCTQCPHNHQEQASKILQVSLNKLRFIAPAIGGGFGQKNGLSLEPYVALMAMKTGRPVKWSLNTAEDFGYSTTRMPIYSTVKLGAKSDGTLMAIDRTHICNTGAFGTTGVIISGKCTYLGSGAYRIPHQRARTWLVYTNKAPSAAMRGFGMTQPTFVMETMMDIMAEKLGMDPMEIRLKNALVDGDVTGTGQKLRAVGLKDILEKLRQESGWDK